jgi:hypothetical protein
MPHEARAHRIDGYQRPIPTTPHPPLPPDLNPVTAGRFGLWLMGLRNQRAASKRVAYPPQRDNRRNVLTRLRALIVPWLVHEYPGGYRFMGVLLGVSMGSAETYLKQPDKLTRVQADRLAMLCHDRAAAFEALARDFEAWRDRPRERKKPFDRGA